jgi:hypothetical protein
VEKLYVSMPSLEINMQSIDSIQKSEVHDLKQGTRPGQGISD